MNIIMFSRWSFVWWCGAFVVIIALVFGNVEARIGEAKTTPMHKVLMTQRGYIQFLRWEMPVPEIHQFTFCLWMKSVNLTLRNSIFSYSHNETVRQISAWVSPYGQSIHLEINNVEIVSASADLKEQRWYHVCQSWSNQDGQYAIWLDAHVIAHGYTKQMAGHVIPSNGNLVVGQEYTDFDKGLEEGIEGAVLGFNLLLASAFSSTSSFSQLYNGPSIGKMYLPLNGIPRANNPSRRRRLVRKIGSDPMLPGETIGEYLIRVSYEKCESGRASPFIDPNIMIISWTRTPVKVFGGAIVKNALSKCGHFG